MSAAALAGWHAPSAAAPASSSHSMGRALVGGCMGGVSWCREGLWLAQTIP
jgi:hypothetical protein